MRILTRKQQRSICVRLIALLRMCKAMAQTLPIGQYAEYADKYITCIAEIAADVGGVPLMVAVGREGLNDENA